MIFMHLSLKHRQLVFPFLWNLNRFIQLFLQFLILTPDLFQLIPTTLNYFSFVLFFWEALPYPFQVFFEFVKVSFLVIIQHGLLLKVIEELTVLGFKVVIGIDEPLS